MREIKFKILDKYRNTVSKKHFKINEKFITGDNYGGADIVIEYICPIDETFEERFQLLQFTGLKDKNGVEIYEKDYVLDKYNQRILVEYDFALLARLKEIQSELILDGNYYE